MHVRRTSAAPRPPGTIAFVLRRAYVFVCVLSLAIFILLVIVGVRTWNGAESIWTWRTYPEGNHFVSRMWSVGASGGGVQIAWANDPMGQSSPRLTLSRRWYHEYRPGGEYPTGRGGNDGQRDYTLRAFGFEYHRRQWLVGDIGRYVWRSIVLPLWFLAFLSLLLPFAWVIGIFRRRRRYRLKHALCLACGYDLRAHTPGAKCPECGTRITSLSGPGQDVVQSAP